MLWWRRRRGRLASFSRPCLALAHRRGNRDGNHLHHGRARQPLRLDGLGVWIDMTPRSARLSEKEKVYAFCLIVPLLWPFIPVLLLCDLFEWIGNGIRSLYWRWRNRR